MAVFDYPDTLLPQAMEWASVKAGVQHRSPFNGTLEAVAFPGERWRVSLTLARARAGSDRAALAEAFFGRLAGGVDQVRLRHFLRPIPRGTMRGAPTLQLAVTRGAQQLVLATTGTLKAGDCFKIGGQLFQALADCTPGGGLLTVPLVQRVRANLAAGAAVEWNAPTFLAIYAAMTHASGYSPGAAAAVQVDLEEVFA